MVPVSTDLTYVHPHTNRTSVTPEQKQLYPRVLQGLRAGQNQGPTERIAGVLHLI